MRPPLELDRETQWGRIAAVCWLGGERYYQMIDEHGAVALMPADVVESESEEPQ